MVERSSQASRPRQGLPERGRHFSKRACKPNSVTVLLPLTVIPLGRSSLNGSSDLPGSLAHRAGTHEVFPPHSFPIWSCSVWGLPCPVHYCPGGALLPHLFTLTAPVEHLWLRGLAPALPSRPAQSGSAFAVHLSAAVYSLWHFPSSGLETTFPDVIRHTALWSSDFPLFWPCSPGKNPASTTRTATIRPDIHLHIIGWNLCRRSSAHVRPSHCLRSL